MKPIAILVAALCACADPTSIEVTFGPLESLEHHDEWTVVTPTDRHDRPVIDVATTESGAIVTVLVEAADCGAGSVIEARSTTTLESLLFPLTRDICEGFGSTEQHTLGAYSFGITCVCSSTYKWCKNCDDCTWYYTGQRC